MSTLPQVLDPCCGGRMFYFDTRDKADLSRAKELEKRVDDEITVIFGGVQTQGTLL